MDIKQERVCDDSVIDRTIPLYVHESAQARAERTIKRLIIVLIMTIVLLFLSNAYWIYQWSQYDYECEDTVYYQDGKGINSINWGSQGDLLNYESDFDYTEETPSP